MRRQTLPPHFGAGTGQCGADAVRRHADLATDFVVRFAFEVIEPHHVSLFAVQFVEQALHLFAIGESLFDGFAVASDIFDLARVGDIGHDSPLEQLAHNNAACDNSQVRGQTALPTEAPQNGEIVRQECRKNFGGQIFQILRSNGNRAALRCVRYDVDNEAQEPIYEVFPCSGLASEAAL